MIEDPRPQHGRVREDPPVQHVVVTAQTNWKSRIAPSQTHVVDVHALTGLSEREPKESKRHFETRNALPVRPEQLDALSQTPAKPAIASQKRIAIAVFEKEKDVSTESDAHIKPLWSAYVGCLRKGPGTARQAQRPTVLEGAGRGQRTREAGAWPLNLR